MRKVSTQDIAKHNLVQAQAYRKEASSVKGIYMALSILLHKIYPISKGAEAAGLKKGKSFNRAVIDAIDEAKGCLAEAKKSMVP